MNQDNYPRPLPELSADAHKGDAGRVLFLCGSPSMPGAALLCLRAAQRAGAGVVTLATFNDAMAQMAPLGAPEAVLVDVSKSRDLYVGRLPAPLADRKDDVRVIGPGLGKGGRTLTLVRGVIRSIFAGPLVLDADALNSIGTELEVLAEHPGPLVLTPHPGEASRMLDRAIPKDDAGRAECAQEIASRSGGVCVLKGARTVVSDGKRQYLNETGNHGMATAGAGDVLAGIMGAYLAWMVASHRSAEGRSQSDFDPFEIASAAVLAHGLSGDLAAEEKGARALIASDLIEYLPRAQMKLST